MNSVVFHSGGESTGSIGEKIAVKSRIQKRADYNQSIFKNNCDGVNCPASSTSENHKIDYLA